MPFLINGLFYTFQAIGIDCRFNGFFWKKKNVYLLRLNSQLKGLNISAIVHKVGDNFLSQIVHLLNGVDPLPKR